MVSRLGSFAERLLDAVSVGLMLLILALVLAQIWFRYALHAPLVWSEELARYAFMWMALLAWVIAARHRSHIRLTLFADMLPFRAQKLLEIVVQASLIAFAGVLVRWGFVIVERNLDVETVTLPIAQGVVYLAVPLAAFGIGLYALSDLARACASLVRGHEVSAP